MRSIPYIDPDHPSVPESAQETAERTGTDVKTAIEISSVVTDDIRYRRCGPVFSHDRLTASRTLAAEEGFCVPEAVLLAAVTGVHSIPSRLASADVRYHLATSRLRTLLGTVLVNFHGFTELLVNRRWVKATLPFTLTPCKEFGTVPLEFDGIDDSVLQPLDRSGNRHMENLADHGPLPDLPFNPHKREHAHRYPEPFNPEDGAAEDLEAEVVAEHRGAA